MCLSLLLKLFLGLQPLFRLFGWCMLSQTCVRCMHPAVGRQQDAYILHKSEVVLSPSLDKVRAGRTKQSTWNPGCVVIAWRQAISAPSSSSPEHTTTINHQKPEILGSLIKPKTPTQNRINGKVTKLGKNLPGAKKCPKQQKRFCPGHPCHDFIGESTLRKALYRHQRNQRLEPFWKICNFLIGSFPPALGWTWKSIWNQNHHALIDSLIEWLIEWLVNWLIDWLVDWLIGWLVDWLIGWLVDWLIGWLVDWLIGWLVDW